MEKAGSWFSIAGCDRKWQGMEALVTALKSDQELLALVRDNLRVEYTND